MIEFADCWCCNNVPGDTNTVPVITSEIRPEQNSHSHNALGGDYHPHCLHDNITAAVALLLVNKLLSRFEIVEL